MSRIAHKLMAASGAGEDSYEIEQSLMFERTDTAKMHFTPSSSGNRRTFTWSGWYKRAKFDESQMMWAAYGANNNAGYNDFGIAGDAAGNEDCIGIGGWTSPGANVKTSRYLRDPSAWYHIMFVSDTTLATEADRVKYYVNGVRETAIESSPLQYPAQNYDYPYNDTVVHVMGDAYYHVNAGSPVRGMNGYLAEVHIIDGTAKAPTDFGEFNETTGQWVPIEYEGDTASYGTNGGYYKFVAGALGTDSSGKGNNYTAVNLADTDVMLDTPTNNFPTLNNLFGAGGIGENVALSQGNLRMVNNSWANYGTSGTIAVATMAIDTSASTGYYWEYYVERSGRADLSWGGITPAGAPSHTTGPYTYSWDTAGQVVRYTPSDTTNIGVSSGEKLSGALLGFALKDNTMWFRMNGTWYGDPAAGTPSAPESGIPLANNIPDGQFAPMLIGFGGYLSHGDVIAVYNFGQNGTFDGNKTAAGNTDANGIGDFFYSVPSGFLALCSKNLPTPTVKKGTDHFNTVIYTGNNATDHDITGVGFQPDLLWLKKRSGTDSHVLNDSVRGVGNSIKSDSNVAEVDWSDYIGPFSSDGFRLADVTSGSVTNASGATFVAWNWKAGGAPTADNSAAAGAVPTAGSVKIDGANFTGNLAGSIAATRLSANTTSAFSITKYEGNDTVGATVAHGLDLYPDLVIIKTLNTAQSWTVSSSELGTTGDTTGGLAEYYIVTLDTDAAKADWGEDNIFGFTSTTFSIGSSGTMAMVNASGVNYVAYCFGEVEGYSKIGTYTGNNSADGPFVYTGFRPAYVMAKDVNAVESWNLLDNKRNAYNPVTLPVWADITNAEGAYGGSGAIDFLSNGFKLRATNGTINGSTNTWIYMAFAEFPFKYANAR